MESTIKVSKHAYRRYAERFKNAGSGYDLEQYVNTNRERLTEEILKMLSYAKLVYSGQVRGNTTRRYYLKDDSIIITDMGGTSVITLYKINFGFTPAVDKAIVTGLVAEIDEKEEEVETARISQAEKLQEINSQLASQEELVKNLVEELNSAKDKRKSLTALKESLQGEYLRPQRELSDLIIKLVSSKDYQEDLEQITGKSK